MKEILFPLILFLATLRVAAADVAMTLVTPSVPVAAGGKVQVDLIAMNPTALDMPFSAPLELPGRLETAAGARLVTLAATSPSSAAVAPGGFAVRHYQLTVPGDVSGHVVLEVTLPDEAVLRAVLDVHAGLGTAEPVTTPLTQMSTTASVASTVSRTFSGRFMPNLPIYFLYGNEAQAVKFQFSFDYRVATLHWGAVGREDVATLRVGYTQRSLWDTASASSPFYDTSYIPEIAVNTDAPLPKEPSWLTWMGLRAGFQHESNGQSGADSRSLNIVYLRPRFVLGLSDAWRVVVLPEIFTYVGDVDDNPQIKDYRGYGKLRMIVGNNDGPALMFTGWTGKDFNHASYQLDLTYPLRIHWLHIESYLQLQYFNGYGESLRSYDQKSNALRFGIGLVR